MTEAEQPRHDGVLGGKESLQTRVYLDANVAFEDGCVHIQNDWDDSISLTANEALSLLLWLKQEQSALERLKEDT